MSASRTVLLRSLRSVNRRAVRSYATSNEPGVQVKPNSAPEPAKATDVDSSARAGRNTALLGGLAGGGAALLLGYSWYHFSGAKSAVATISQTKQYADQITEKVKQKAPEPNQALQWLRETANSYAGFIPGARGYVDKAFDDLDRIHEKHGGEMDEIVNRTSKELKRIAQEKGASVEGIYEGWSELEHAMRDIRQLAGGAAEEILENHPDLRQKLGGSFQKLQSMGESAGGEVKEQVNQTFDEVRRIFSQGSSAEAIQKAKHIVEQKTQEITQKSDDLWQKGLAQVKPYLEKSPKAKKLLEENKDVLKEGNMGYLWAQVRNAADTGSTQQLESFIQNAKEKAKGGSSTSLLSGLFSGSGSDGMSKMLQAATGDGDLMSSVQSWTEAAQKHGGEAEKLLESTVEEIKDVLKKRSKEAKNIVNEVKGESA